MSSARPNPGTLRVLHLNSLLTGGGTDDQCVKVTHGLRQLGVEASLAGPEGRDYTTIARDLGIPFYVTPREGPLKLRFIIESARWIRRLKIHIVHGHHGRDIWPTLLAARLSGTQPKIVLTRHMAKSPSSWLSRRFLLGRCDAIIAVSRFVAEVLCEGHYEPGSPERERHARPPLRGDYSRIRVLQGGIDTSRFRPFDAAAQRREWGLGPGDYAFGVVGGYDLPRGKGQREFLRAAARIQAQVPAARFLIIGRGNLEDRLRGDIRELGLEGKAWLTPYSRNVPAAMNAIDCLVHPQVGTEALGMVVLEAFACGKPVIASALDGIPEAFDVAKLGQLVPPENVEALAEAMQAWAGQPAPSPERQAEMHARVERDFSLAAAVGRVNTLYEQLMRDQPARDYP
ncbi:MAG TPA: glycosyltransferase [Clostridia bacterium]|nr:glycosyltransferase [Clostridia bacterium]